MTRKTKVGSIVLDQTDPKVGDTVTFTTTGGVKISVAVYGDGIGSGPLYAAEGPIGTAFTLGAPGEGYAWLDGDRDLSNGFLAAIRFLVAAR